MPRPERSFRTPALILRRRDFGEADRLLTVLTPGHGRRDVIAKGARRPAGKRTGHVELYTEADMLINVGRDLDIAAQTTLTQPWLPLREDLQRGAYASYVAELVIRFTGDSSDEPSALFRLLGQTFSALSTSPDPRLPVRYFEVHLLDLSGFKPELSTCVISRVAITPRDQYFSYADGGVVSPEAAQRGAGALVPLSLNALKVLRHMQRSVYDDVSQLRLSAALHAELERVMQGYIIYLLERRLQSVDFIRRVRE
ncbi:MAG: DNA repair protein RecO [Chloroflexi bacterium]|nr:DNA repair protein RecO [Anaerolineae bacterium]MCC6567483.1 DNA repair protein RecO [Chloroflexota bacterium]OQY83756.1 MAG: DNA repair protein RecO [Anaerolineae bacterium UTCFX5]MEB2367439.1 DNA repair protein RecO [Chloroflexota bacterium]RIK18579.1 MAG: DNA repair protein RecO [Chloroflexota bacterium]